MRTPHHITITIDTGNAAFDDCEHGEVSRILRTACRSFEYLLTGDNETCISRKALFDVNGNSIGAIDIEPIK